MSIKIRAVLFLNLPNRLWGPFGPQRTEIVHIAALSYGGPTDIWGL